MSRLVPTRRAVWPIGVALLTLGSLGAAGIARRAAHVVALAALGAGALGLRTGRAVRRRVG